MVCQPELLVSKNNNIISTEELKTEHRLEIFH